MFVSSFIEKGICCYFRSRMSPVLRMVGSSGIDVRMLLSRGIQTLLIRIWARIFLVLTLRA